jgi:selenide,water dikinase
VLRPLQDVFDPQAYPDLLVGLASPDDAAVWKLNDRQALVVTTDFFTPVVDDPYDYGSIAAANALSDIYAMGADPILALNVAAIPANLEADLLAEIFRGGAEKVREAGAVLAGGHTVQDNEPKYGLVAVGLADPRAIMTKKAACPGDILVLTKPLGTGVITTALKREAAEASHVAEVVNWMRRLNAGAGRLARQAGVRAATDVTGYGLLGHASEMAEASGVGMRIHLGSIPFFSSARFYARRGYFPGGSADNRLYFSSRVNFGPSIGDEDQMLLFDAQTSGGLLLCVPGGSIAGFLASAGQAGQPAWVIGEVVAGQGIRVVSQAYGEEG